MSTQYDVIVVGGGFAGVTAARDLSRTGQKVLLLEARDRLGGRTWTKEVDELGATLELGGQFVHWSQPFLWSEVRRHGLELCEAIPTERAYWLANDDEVKSRTGAELKALLAAAMEKVTADSRAAYPNPYATDRERLREADHETASARFDRVGLTDEQHEVLLAAEMEPNTQSIALVLRWTSLYFGYWPGVGAAGQCFRLATGMRGLIDAIASESSAEVRYEAAVTEIDDQGDGVTVTTQGEQKITARAALVAVPINKMADINFTAGLSSDAEQLLSEGTVQSGFKMWARVRGEIEPFAAYAAQGTNVIYGARVDQRVDADTLVVGFGRGTVPAGFDKEAIQQELRRFVPDLEVAAAVTQDWAGEEFSKTGWIVPRPGQISEKIPALHVPHGRVWFAGSDIAEGFQGWVEGAIDSASIAAQSIAKSLSA